MKRGSNRRLTFNRAGSGGGGVAGGRIRSSLIRMRKGVKGVSEVGGVPKPILRGVDKWRTAGYVSEERKGVPIR